MSFWSTLGDVATGGADVFTLGGYSALKNAVDPSKPAAAGTSGTGAGQVPYSGFPVPAASGSVPQTNFQGNLGAPGQAENYFAQNQGGFGAPSASSSYYQQYGNPQAMGQSPAAAYYAGHAGAQSPGLSDNAQSAYNQFQGSTPANTDPYYQQAMQQANGAINNQMASRGLFNSSAATDAISGADANLAGQQALANSQYGLQRGQIAGQLGQSADQSSLQNAQNQLAWLQGIGGLAGQAGSQQLAQVLGLGSLAGQADQTHLAGLSAGMNAAQAAQAAEANRGQNYFGNLLGMGNAYAAPELQTGTAAINGDIQNQQDQISMLMAAYEQANNASAAQGAQLNNAFNSVMGGIGTGPNGGNTGFAALAGL